MERYRVWDWPSRLSHWAMAVLFGLLFVSGQFGWLSAWAHLWLGYALLVAVVFRILWGFFGSDSARFSRFLCGPKAVWRYLAALAGNQPTYSPGHNPIGGWSVVLMLVLLLLQSVTGLFIETWGEVRGPLAERVGRETAIAASDLHAVLTWLLLVTVGIHIAAALYYRLRKREDRIGPIFGSGQIALPHRPDLRFAGSGRALVILAVSGAIVATTVVFGPI